MDEEASNSANCNRLSRDTFAEFGVTTEYTRPYQTKTAIGGSHPSAAN